MLTTHAITQLNQRLKNTGADITSICANLNRIAQLYKFSSVAVIVKTLDKVYFDEYTRSNGNLIVAIIRNGLITTVFLRRDYQPMTCDKLGVSEVIALPE